MRRAMVGLAVVLLLAGCGPASKDDAYLEVVRPLSSLTDEQWLALRATVCDELAKQPNTAQWALEVRVLMNTIGLTAREAGQVIGASTASACPQFDDAYVTP